MNKQEFLNTVEKLATIQLIRVAKKGAHEAQFLGTSCIGSTTRQNEKIWRKFGTLNNIIIFQTADEVNAILEANNITRMKAFNTKSSTMSRLRNF